MALTPLMKHGDLLVFDGGSTLHSMFPTNLDPAFNPNGFDWRISIIFRWTTDIMREYGPGAEGVAIQDSKKQYDADRQTWRAANIKPRVFSIRTGKFPPNVVYIGCRTGEYQGTVYGNDYEPFEGHKNRIAENEKDFRAYAIKKMQDPGFRAQALKDLRGKHLLCRCVQERPKRAPFCHARVWLELVNVPEGKGK